MWCDFNEWNIKTWFLPFPLKTMLHTSSDHLPIWARGFVQTKLWCLQAAKFAWQPLSWASSSWSNWSTQMTAPTCRIDTWHALRMHANAALSDSETSIRWVAGACIETVGSSIMSVSSITVSVHGHTVGSCKTSVHSISVSAHSHTVGSCIPSVSSISVSVHGHTMWCQQHHCDCSRSLCHVCTVTVAVQGHTVMSAPVLWLFQVTVLCLHHHWLLRVTLCYVCTISDCSRSHCVMSALSLFTVTLSCPLLLKVTQPVPSLWLFKATHCHASTITVTVKGQTVMSALSLTYRVTQFHVSTIMVAVQSHTVCCQHHHWPQGRTMLCQHQHCNCWRPHWHAITVLYGVSTITDLKVKQCFVSTSIATVEGHTDMPSLSVRAERHTVYVNFVMSVLHSHIPWHFAAIPHPHPPPAISEPLAVEYVLQ